MTYEGFAVGEKVKGSAYVRSVSGYVVERPYPPAGTVPVLYEYKNGCVLQYEQPGDLKRIK